MQKEEQTQSQSKQQDQQQLQEQQSQHIQKEEEEENQKPKAKPPPRKMDLSQYDDIDDDNISLSNAPESAATSDERVKSRSVLNIISLKYLHFNTCYVSF